MVIMQENGDARAKFDKSDKFSAKWKNGKCSARSV
jgi:hypothetical protein